MKKSISFRWMTPNDNDTILNFAGNLNRDVTRQRLKKYLEEMWQTGFKCAGAFLSDGTCAGICGVWIGTKFYCGRYLELDDFIIDDRFRSDGIGHDFMSWLESYAKEQGCNTIMLDAFAANTRSHKFYYREGYEIKGYHFTRVISDYKGDDDLT